MTRRCTCCGVELVRLEADHPDGRVRSWRSRRSLPVYPEIVEDLCVPCHQDKGLFDRAAGVEGASVVSLQLILGRRASWAAFLAHGRRQVTLEASHLSDLALVLEHMRTTLLVVGTVIHVVATELHRRGHDDLAASLDGVAWLIGGPSK